MVKGNAVVETWISTEEITFLQIKIPRFRGGRNNQMDMDNMHFMFIHVRQSPYQYVSMIRLSQIRNDYPCTFLLYVYCGDWSPPFQSHNKGNKIRMNVTWTSYLINFILCTTIQQLVLPCVCMHHTFFSETQNVNKKKHKLR